MYCYHYDPQGKQYSLVAMNVMRLGGGVTLVAPRQLSHHHVGTRAAQAPRARAERGATAHAREGVTPPRRRTQPERTCHERAQRTRDFPATRADVDDRRRRRLALLLHLLASVVLFVAIVGAMVWWAIKYRERKGHKAEPTGHNMPLEIAWTIAPIFILVFMFHKGFQGYMDMAVAPANAMEIRVNAKQWAWEFVYPNGGSSDELHVPVHQPVKLVMGSADVHPLVLRAGASREARRRAGHVLDGLVRGDARRPRRHRVRRVLRRAAARGPTASCPTSRATTRCIRIAAGQATGHWSMHSMLYVETPEDFDEVRQEHRRPVRPVRRDRQEVPRRGRRRAGREALPVEGLRGVPHDHGRPARRPLVEGHLGQDRGDRQRPDEGGRAVRPPSRSSTRTPKIVTGFQGVMPTFRGQISDAEIDELTAYIKSLKE